MKYLEIIELRAAGNIRDLLESQLQSIILELEDKSAKQTIKIYSHEMLDTDFSILLFHDSMKAEKGGSRLGLHLASALKIFGLVNHSIWNEIDSK